ncbi:MAG TPA: DUF4349 domain-containing protein [Ilumatobacteraceae bacterium]|nr:DUF4349 domain-containing protein [Ilumatobacteraceae bacterium]
MGRYNTTAALALVVLVGLGVSACGSDNDSASVPDATVATPQGRSGDGSAGGVADESAPPAESSLTGSSTSSIDVSGQALVTTAGVTVTTSNVRKAVDDTLSAVERNNASVYNADVSIGDEGDGGVDGSGYFVVKVPPVDLEPLIADLGSTVGTLSGRTQDTSDVTEQLVDLDIRIGVERDVIGRFQVLLTQATEFQDIVEIERVISERTIALEQLLAGQRDLENRVELSTLTISLQYVVAAPEVTAASSNTITDAWHTGWDVFVGILFAIGLVLAVAAPFLASAALVLGVVWFAGRRRRTNRSAPSNVAVPVLNERDEEFAAPNPEG